MTDDKNRIDLTDPAFPGRTRIHLRGYHGDGGENEGVLWLTAMLDESPMYPESGRIMLGSHARASEATRSTTSPMR